MGLRTLVFLISTTPRIIPKLKPDIFKGVPQQKKLELLQLFSFTSCKTHIGPLPDAETLKEYSVLIPNGADRVMKMAEEQSKHRMFLEKRHLQGNLSKAILGNFLPFLSASQP